MSWVPGSQWPLSTFKLDAGGEQALSSSANLGHDAHEILEVNSVEVRTVSRYTNGGLEIMLNTQPLTSNKKYLYFFDPTSF